MTAEARDAAIREAKRYIHEIVRNDWVFEPSSSVSGAPVTAEPTDPDNEISEWRLREYGSSGSEFEAGSPTNYGPDYTSSGASGGESRRRRRRQLEEEEMSWNIGLRTWVQRRDKWTGAQSKDEVRAKEQKKQAAHLLEVDEGHSGSALSPQSSVNVDSGDLAARTETSLAIAEKDGNEAELGLQVPQVRDGEEPSTADQAPTETVPQTTQKTSGSLPSIPSTVPSSPEVEDPLIPVAPSLIPSSNLIRASITPAMYPSIYSKVVVQGLTPTVPINLADVTKAMVQGWKSDGQWPPQPTSIVLQDDSIVRRNGNDAGEKPASHEKKRSGVASAVRKVLHFSGFHPHAFHRRGSSHGSHNDHPDGHKKDGAAAEHQEK